MQNGPEGAGRAGERDEEREGESFNTESPSGSRWSSCGGVAGTIEADGRLAGCGVAAVRRGREEEGGREGEEGQTTFEFRNPVRKFSNLSSVFVSLLSSSHPQRHASSDCFPPLFVLSSR